MDERGTTPRRSGRVIIPLIVIVAVAALAVAGLYTWRSRTAEIAFPELPPGLNAGQKRVLTIAKAQHENPAPPTTYSEGVAEDWCADFVSWNYHQAGLSFKNPNSGWWRIPGVFTMTDYFVKQKRWHSSGSNYNPQPGDVVVYKTGSFMGAHVNIVIRRDGDTMTTIGGNQPGISVLKIDRHNDAISGFGNPRTV